MNAVESRFPTARGEGLHRGIEDKLTSFYVDAQGLNGTLEVQIEGPQNYTKNYIERLNDGSYMVKYTPVEVGLYRAFIRWNGREIPGSPYLSYVVNPNKVKIIGGWQSILDHNNVLNMKLYEEKVINFDTSEAGPGTMHATMVGPNNVKVPLKLASQGTIYSLNFTTVYEGEYKINLSWDNYELPNTPIIVRTLHESDMSKIEVSGPGLHEAKINNEAEFLIDGSHAGDLSGLPEVRLTGTRCDIEVRALQLGYNIYRCSYVPSIPGY